MDPTERWIRTLLMYIFYDVYRDRHLSVAYLEAPFRESAFIPILSFPPSNSHPSTAGCAAWIRGILYLMRARVKHETGRVVGSDALRLGNWEFQWLVRDCGQISGRSFFTRPSRKSRTKIRQRVAIKRDSRMRKRGPPLFRGKRKPRLCTLWNSN